MLFFNVIKVHIACCDAFILGRKGFNRFIMLKYFLFFCIFLPHAIKAQILPEVSGIDWSSAGNYSNPEPDLTLDIQDFGAYGDGVHDDYFAFEAAISFLAGKAGIIELSAGHYLLRSSLGLPQGVILRGRASGAVTLLFDLNGAEANCINISSDQTNAFIGLTSGYTKGSDSLTVSDISAFQVGDFVEIRQLNGDWDITPANWAKYCVGQISRITGIEGHLLHLEDELRITYDYALNPEIRKINPITDVGLECLRLERLDEASSGYNVHFRYSVNCRIKGVESSKSAGAHILADASAHLEIRDSYFHHAFTYDGGATRGYGVTLIQHTSDCLIENNIFQNLRHSMMVKQGSNGNVFGYNYSLDPYRSEIPNNAGGDISLHGHFPYANLFEGNIVQTIHIDQAWGPSGPYNTFLRNRAELYGILMTEGTFNSDYQNFIGNEVTNTGFLMGNYIIKGAGHFIHGNNIRGSIIPEGTNSLRDASYYLPSVPEFWDAGMAWPSIGISNSLGSGSIPAKTGYRAGFRSICESIVTAVKEKPPFTAVVYPNPFSEMIQLNVHTAAPANVRIKDLLGKILYSTYISTGKTTIKLDTWPTGKGIYFVEIEAGGIKEIYKIIKAE